jgi:GTP diphosphokinase / guanosine-3',5'-bis(diphosphate) 3'-diphosphatase
MSNPLFNIERNLLHLYFDALEFAAYKHRFQKRKGANGIPYINHPIEVARLIIGKLENPSPELILGALLHDTLEDTDATPAEIEAKFGSAVLSLIREVTDNMKQSSAKRKELQIIHAKSLSPEAGIIKIADKTCNIRDIILTRMYWSKWQKIEYVRWAVKVVEQIESSYPMLIAEFEDTLRLAEEKLNTEFRLTRIN